MWTDGKTDMARLIVAFHNFGKATKNTVRIRLTVKYEFTNLLWVLALTVIAASGGTSILT